MYQELPEELISFLSYKGTIQNRSAGTVKEYAFEISAFLRYVLAVRNGKTVTRGDNFAGEDISKADLEFLKSIETQDIFAYLIYLAEIGNAATTRARKLVSIRSFFKYLTVKTRKIAEDPTASIDSPKIKKTLPMHLSLDDSLKLLDSVGSGSADHERNYAICTLFLNCGIRLSELVGLNLYDIDSKMEKMTVTGKGSKMRTVYLNDACRSALKAYLEVRQRKIAEGKTKIRQGDKNALFLSRLGRRISPQTVQWMVKRYLKSCGLDRYSTHKLRHTAATLMYNEGGVDVRTLKDILGHEQLNTTQIYTHVSDKKMEAAINSNPLSGVHAANKNGGFENNNSENNNDEED